MDSEDSASKNLVRTYRWIALAAIICVSAFLRFWQAGTIPPGYHYDEAFEGLEAWKLLTEPGYHPVFFTGNFGVEPLFIYLTSVAFRLGGAGPAAQRAVAAILGTLTVPAVYGLASELDRWVDGKLPRLFPLCSAVSLAILRWHVHFSRVGIEPVLVPLLLIVASWGMWRGWRKGTLWPFLVAGLCSGLGWYAYPAGRLLLPLAAGLACLLGLADRARLGARAKGLAAAALVALLVLAPLGREFWRNPELLTLRSGQVTVAASEGAGLIANTLRTFGMFSVRGDVNPRSNLPGRPALDWFVAVPFYLGLALAVCRSLACLRRSAHAEQRGSALRSLGTADGGRACCAQGQAVWWFVLLAGAIMLLPTVLSEYAPHFRRAIGAIPTVALLTGLGLSTAVGWAEEEGAHDQRGRMASLLRVAIICLVLISLLGSGCTTSIDYFTRWAGSADLYYAFDVGLWEIGQYASELPAGELVYLTPRPAADTTLAFAWRDGPQTRHFDGRHAFVLPVAWPLADRPATYIVIEREDFRGTKLLRGLYPGAQQVHELRDREGQLYATVLRIARTGMPARAPQHERKATWDGISLLGYDLNSPVYHAGETIYLQLWWSSDAEVTQRWKVFTHLLGPAKPDGNPVWSGSDAEPGQGSVPTSTWQQGELILDEYQLQLPSDLPAGTYSLEVGLYEPAGGERWPALVAPLDDPAAPKDEWQAADHAILGDVHIQGERVL